MGGGSTERQLSPARRSRPAADSAPILLALPDRDRAGRLALACTERKLLPTLAFSAEQVGRVRARRRTSISCSSACRSTATGSGRSRHVVRRFGDPIVVLLDREELPNPALAELGVLAEHRRRASDGEIASRAAALLSLERRDVRSSRSGGDRSSSTCRAAERAGGARPIDLTPIQFKLLARARAGAGRGQSRDQLAELVWGSVPTDDGERVVAHIRRIRTKLEPDPSHPVFLLTARGEGFRLADPGAVEDRERRADGRAATGGAPTRRPRRSPHAPASARCGRSATKRCFRRCGPWPRPRSRPRRGARSDRRGRAARRGVPISTSRPSSTTAMRSQRAAVDRRCATTTDRAALREALERALDRQLGARDRGSTSLRRGRAPRVGERGAHERHELPLAARQPRPALAHLGVEAVRIARRSDR